ncbi:MAG: DNA polymerase III subunit beta [Candidatus Berkelbacteria bacterium]|nr:DNA polymerase III subunit beta [Candidatus Berkelbacteria bacterium]
MKLSCTQENLNKGLNIIGRLARPQATLPVLSNILLKTENGRLKLSATDLEIGANCYIGAKIEKNGAVTIPAKLLIEYVSMSEDKRINLSVSFNVLSLESDKGKAKIKGIDASEFPLIPEIKEKPLISLPANQLREAITQVSIAPSLDETKPALCGICLKLSDKQVKLVATDSFRLAEKIIYLDKEVENKEIIVPARTLIEVSRIVSLIHPASISIIVSKNQVLFIMDEVQIVSRIIEGSFPDYEPIIPKETETVAIIETTAFQNTLKIANLFARETGSNIKLELNKDKIIVKAVSALLGENISNTQAEISGPKVEITFNAKFLLDALAVIPSMKVSLGVSGRLNPGLIKPVGQKGYTYLIMPLQTE